MCLMGFRAELRRHGRKTGQQRPQAQGILSSQMSPFFKYVPEPN
jgi:hypothetical protein